MRGLFFFAAALGGAQDACAGPWTQEPRAFFGHLSVTAQEVEQLDGVRTDLYAEYGLARGWTLVAKAEAAVFDGVPELNQQGGRFGVRRSIWSGGPLLVAAEAGLVGGEAVSNGNGCEELGGELRITTGASGAFRGRNWFTFVDVLTRHHVSGCARQRLEMGFGQEVARNWFTISQLYLERGTEASRSDKWEVAVMRRFDSFDVSLGYREEFGGVFQERGVVFAVGKRF